MFKGGKGLSWFFAVTLSLLFAAYDARACTGSPGPFHFHPAADYWRATVVFTGRVTEVVRVPIQVGEGEKKQVFIERVARFEAEEAFRGTEGRVIEVVSGQRSMCLYEFEAGERYIVYALRSSDGKLRASLFSRTRPLAEAAEDVAYARDVARGERGARIVGLVQRAYREDARDYGRREPLPGVPVTIEGVNGQRWEIVTGEGGKFEVRGASPGRYRVRPHLAEGLRSSQFPEEVRVSDEQHPYAGVVFTTTSLNSITGRVVNEGGEPVASLMIDLLSVAGAGESEEVAAALATAVSDGEGRYTFDYVPPGNYLVAINPMNHRGRGLPAYPRSFYPGAESVAKATVIPLKESQTVLNEDFRIPPPLKKRAFTGVVLLSDGTAAAGARVYLIDPDDKTTGVISSVQADEKGEFSLEGHEGFRYLIEAIADVGDDPRRKAMYSPAVKIPPLGESGRMRLVISSPVAVRSDGAAPR